MYVLRNKTQAHHPRPEMLPAFIRFEVLVASYAKSVGNLDQNLARRVWSARNEVTFIYPRGTERGLDAILKNFYQNTMGLFSERQLIPDPAETHVYGDTAWSQFTWTFRATLKNGGKEITTKGRETQVYHKEDGGWPIVHVHYSGMRIEDKLDATLKVMKGQTNYQKQSPNYSADHWR